MSSKSLGIIRNRELDMCLFCHRDTDDVDILGQKLQKDGLVVHYFCLLFASGLCQRGKTEKQGIMGFLTADILKECHRARKLKCSFCKSIGATIGCVIPKCRITFHLPCGQEHGVLTQFMDEFKAFCEAHRPKQVVPTESALDSCTSFLCVICMNNIETKPSNSVLYAPCCKNSWFHRNCLQCYATSSGLHFFRCPLCNDKDAFQKEMLRLGIYIPDQDASWEREPNAFQELLVRHNQCDAVKCLCLYGRNYNSESSKWELVLCDWCGSNGTHLACSKLQTAEDDWVCRECYKACSLQTKNKNIRDDSYKGTASAETFQDKQAKETSTKKQIKECRGRQHSINHDMISRRSFSLTRQHLLPSDKRIDDSKDESSNHMVLGCRLNNWTPEEKKFGYQLQIHLTRLTDNRIQKTQTRRKHSRRNRKRPRFQQLSILQAFRILKMRKALFDAVSEVPRKDNGVLAKSLSKIKNREPKVPHDKPSIAESSLPTMDYKVMHDTNKAKQDQSSVRSVTRDVIDGEAVSMAKDFRPSSQPLNKVQHLQSSDRTMSNGDNGMLANISSRYIAFAAKYFRKEHVSLPKKLMHYQDFIRKGILPE